MIRYHGGPITPRDVAIKLWSARHGMTSFAHPEQVSLMAEVCQSFVLDCGAYSFWRAGHGEVDVLAYQDFVWQWELHPGFDWAIIPDKIDGSEKENDALIEQWLRCRGTDQAVPVWHLHEELRRLDTLVDAFPRIAIGSSGEYADPGSVSWWERMDDVMDRVCNEFGQPMVKLHGLRMLSPTIFSHIPLSSADSCNVARNCGIDKKWSGPYKPITPATRALVLAERIELHAVAAVWSGRRGIQQNLTLIG